jgi:7,8-dihydropterin-6-yl-methyl-4-(beta-D-ribofuranosyl)aminobenzene 5'-phosphate synthase
VLPGFWLFSTVSDVTGTKEMNDFSMAIRTPQGLTVVVGWSHPGETPPRRQRRSIRASTASSGFQLVDATDAEGSSIVTHFRDKWKFERVAAGHCTGGFVFSQFNRVFGAKYDHGGVGAVIALPK